MLLRTFLILLVTNVVSYADEVSMEDVWPVVRSDAQFLVDELYVVSGIDAIRDQLRYLQQ